jgi:hypothetical protein
MFAVHRLPIRIGRGAVGVESCDWYREDHRQSTDFDRFDNAVIWVNEFGD